MSTLRSAREAFAQRRWRDAYTQLSEAGREQPLEPDDSERLSVAAQLIGRDADSIEAMAQAHRELVTRGEVERAARSAFWLGFQLIFAGEPARGSGWLERSRRLLEGLDRESVVHGYLLMPRAMRQLREGEGAEAHAMFCQAAEIGSRFSDVELVIMARQGQGRALVRLGRVADGMALLDEVMVAVTGDELPSIMVGGMYCSVLEACHESFDLRRAQEWTAALSAWCATQPDLVPYRGSCLIRRAELHQLHGAWPEAMDEALRACTLFSMSVGHPSLGAARYQQGELHRLRGEFELAEEAYRDAGRAGAGAQPGRALMRLAQHDGDAAAAAIRGMVDEAHDVRMRATVMAATVEIMLAAHETPEARVAAEELARIASASEAPFLRALSAQAMGALRLAEGDARAALAELRVARDTWRALDAPYESARAHVLCGLAHRALADDDTASMELDAAAALFRRLGAAPDLARLETLARHTAEGAPSPLTARELQVLRLVATGKTNRAIATRLAISEKTVARHVSNIFTKLSLSSRAAATAYAYQHQLVQRYG